MTAMKCKIRQDQESAQLSMFDLAAAPQVQAAHPSTKMFIDNAAIQKDHIVAGLLSDVEVFPFIISFSIVNSFSKN